MLFGSCIQPKTSKRTTAFFFVTFSLSWTVQLFKPCTTLMSIRLERERIWWNINGSINQSNAFLGSNPWPCPNGLHSNPVNHWAWKGGYFWSYEIKIQTHFDFRIQTLGEFLATSVTLLIVLLGGADTTLKIYFKNSHESKVFSKVTWIWIWIDFWRVKVWSPFCEVKTPQIISD